MVLVDLVQAPFATFFVEPVKTCVVSRTRKLLPILIPAWRKWIGFGCLHGRRGGRDIAVYLDGGCADFLTTHSNHEQSGAFGAAGLHADHLPVILPGCNTPLF